MCMQPLIDGMTPEERGFKRGRSSGGGHDSAEHAAKRARVWDGRPEMPTEAQAALQRLQSLARPNQVLCLDHQFILRAKCQDADEHQESIGREPIT